jgi:flagellin
MSSLKSLHSQQQRASSRLSTSMQRLSTGNSLVSIGDRPADQGLSASFRHQVRSNNAAIKVAQNGVNLLQSTDQWLQQTHDIINRMSELAIAGSDGSKSKSDRSNLNIEYQSLMSEISRMASDAKYNGVPILAPSAGKVTPLSSFNASEAPEAYTLGSSLGQTNLFYAYQANGLSTAMLVSGEEEAQAISFDEAAAFTLGGGTWETMNGYDSTSGAIEITYSYSNLFNGSMTGITEDEMKQAVEEALELWADYAPLSFTEVSDSGPTASDVSYVQGTAPDIRFGNHAIDGAGTVLAHAYYPMSTGLSGDVHYDTGETWSVDLFLETTVHEIGHSLGIGHEPLTGNTAVMNPIYAARYDGFGSAFIYEDDIDAVQDLYGVRNGENFIFQLGSEKGMTLEFEGVNIQLRALGIDGTDVLSFENAQSALSSLQVAQEYVSEKRSYIGAQDSRLLHSLSSSGGYVDNLSAVESRLREVDIAKESAEMTVQQILTNANISILAQANSNIQSLTRLLA